MNQIARLLIVLILFSGTWLSAQITDGSAIDFVMRDYNGNEVLSSQNYMKGLTGTVGLGVVAYADSNLAIDTASYDIAYLNRVIVGMGTGLPGIMQTKGIAAHADATEVGRMYYLGVTGTLRLRPTATNVWRAPVGRCIKIGYINLNPGTPIAR